METKDIKNEDTKNDVSIEQPITKREVTIAKHSGIISGFLGGFLLGGVLVGGIVSLIKDKE